MITLSGNLTIAGENVSDQVSEFRISGTADIVEDAPTAAHWVWTPVAGGERWTIQINYRSSFMPAALTRILFANFGQTLQFSGTMLPGAVSYNNPELSGWFLASAWGLGGSVYRPPLEDSPTFRLTSRPTWSES